MTIAVAPGRQGRGHRRGCCSAAADRRGGAPAARRACCWRSARDNEPRDAALRAGRLRADRAAPRGYYQPGDVDALVMRRRPLPKRADGGGARDVDEPLVLGIETSCDETGVGIVRGTTLLADAVASSVDEHARFGGVVPEVASRAHLEAMVPTIERACADGRRPARRRRRDRRHGRPGPGRRAARRRRRGQGARARARQAALRRQPPRRARRRRRRSSTARCPSRRWRCSSPAGTPRCCSCPTSPPTCEPLGATIDDAAGEAFDKVARLLGLPFPGGPHDRPGRARGRPGRDRLPARADRPPRPGAAPVRLLVLRPQDRGRPLGRAPAGAPASRCRWPTSRPASRRPSSTCSPARRSPPAGSTASSTCSIGGGVAANSRLRALAAGAVRRRRDRLRVPAARAVHRQRRDGRRARRPAGAARPRGLGPGPARRLVAAGDDRPGLNDQV